MSFIENDELPIELDFIDGLVITSNLSIDKQWQTIFTDKLRINCNELDSGNRVSLQSDMQQKIVGSSILDVNNQYSFITNFKQKLKIDSFLRLNDEPNILLQTNMKQKIQSSGAFGNSIALSTQFKDKLKGSVLLSLILSLRTDFAQKIESNEALTIIEGQKYEVPVMVEVIPASLTSGNFQEYRARLIINGSNIPIRRVEISAPPNSVGTVISATLSRPSDKSLIVDGASYKLEIAEVVSGIENWHTVIESDRYNSKTYSIGWGSNQPTDQLTFSAPSALIDKLAKFPISDAVFYDPTQLDLSADDFEKVYDLSGNVYTTLIYPSVNLSVYDLFQKIFVERCGFTNYKTNIPNYRIKRLDVSMFSSYLDSIGQIIGNFEPLFFEQDGVLWIIDATAVLPSGFPSPRVIGVNRYSTFSQSKQNDQIEVFEINYSEDDSSFDFYTINVTVETNFTGVASTFNYINTRIETRTREYRRNSNPSVVVSSAVEKVETKRTDSSGHILSITTEVFSYDGLGREIKNVITSQERVPIYLGDDLSESLETVSVTTSKTTYAQHPYEYNKQFKKRTIQEVDGLFYIDSDKYLDNDYKQLYTDAHLNGNISPSGSRQSGPVSSRTETITPLPNGEAKLKVEEWNFLVSPPSLVLDKSDTAVGDVGLNSTLSRQRKIRVSLDNTLIVSSKRKAQMSIGDMPIQVGIALATRLLNKRKFKGHEASMDIIGIDWAIRRGLIIKALGRESEDLGNYIIEGYSALFDELGLPNQNVSMTINGVQV